MKYFQIKPSIIFFLSFFLINSCFSFEDEIIKTFGKKENLKISVASADCFLNKSATNEIKIKILHTYDRENYIPEFTEGENELSIKEYFKENNMSGKAKWYIEIPDNVNITLKSASGCAEAENINCKLKLNTASGAIKINKVNGEMDLHTASGNLMLENVSLNISIKTASGNVSISKAKSNIELSTASGDIKFQDITGKATLSSASGEVSIKNLLGTLKVNNVSGNIEIINLTLNEKSSFSTVSGDIEIKLSQGLKEDLSFSTVSGDISLNFNGNSTNGYYDFKTKSNSGKIKVPEGFELASSNDDDSRSERIYKSGNCKPNIKISTLSGSILINK